MLEAAIQAARWLAEASSDFTLSLDVCEITAWQAGPGLRPGERLLSSVQVTERVDKRITLAVRQTRIAPGAVADKDEDAKAPVFHLVSEILPLAPLYLPLDRQTLWREIFV
jgi:hypothetical protein